MPETVARTLDPLSMDEIIRLTHEEHGSINKHLLTIYSLVIGLNAKRVLEVGAGYTTRTLRAALKHTRGKLFSCDWDREKWGHIQSDEHFEFHIGDSKDFVQKMEGPFDLIIHDGPHDLWQVTWDLERLWPMMRQFGIICVHDTQNSVCGENMQSALKKAFINCPVSWTHLPYNYGLTLIRIEKEQAYPPIDVQWTKKDYEGKTLLKNCGFIDLQSKEEKKKSLKENTVESLKFLNWLRRKAAGK